MINIIDVFSPSFLSLCLSVSLVYADQSTQFCWINKRIQWKCQVKFKSFLRWKKPDVPYLALKYVVSFFLLGSRSFIFLDQLNLKIHAGNDQHIYADYVSVWRKSFSAIATIEIWNWSSQTIMVLYIFVCTLSILIMHFDR